MTSSYLIAFVVSGLVSFALVTKAILDYRTAKVYRSLYKDSIDMVVYTYKEEILGMIKENIANKFGGGVSGENRRAEEV